MIIAQNLIKQGHWVCCYSCRGIEDSEGDYTSTSIKEHSFDFFTITNYLQDVLRIKNNNIVGIGFSLGATIILESISYNKMGLKKLVLLSPAWRPNIDMWPEYNKQLEEGPIVKH